MIIQNAAKRSDVISLKPAAVVVALNACVVVSLENGPSPKLILPASPNPMHPSKSPAFPSWILFTKQVRLGYRASDGVGLSCVPRGLANSHGDLMGGIGLIFPPERNTFPGRSSGPAHPFQDIQNRLSSHAELFRRLHRRKARSICSAYCGFIFGRVLSALMPDGSVNEDHFCFFRKSSMARRISSATERPVFSAIA